MAGDIDLLTQIATRQEEIRRDISEMKPKVDDLSKWKDECDTGRRLILWVIGSLGAAGAGWATFWDKLKWW